jgi:hypothetical protein
MNDCDVEKQNRIDQSQMISFDSGDPVSGKLMSSYGIAELYDLGVEARQLR